MGQGPSPGIPEEIAGLNAAIQALRQSHYPDERTAPFDAHLEAGPWGLRLVGRVLRSDQHQALEDVLSSHGLTPGMFQDELQVLLTAETPWGVVQRGVDDLRREPSNHAERVSQVLFGETVHILEAGSPGSTAENWLLVQLEHDGYLGWTHKGAISTMGITMEGFREDALVIADFLPFSQLGVPTPAGRGAPSGYTAGWLPFGVRLQVQDWEQDWVTFHLPDGSMGRADRYGVLPLSELPGRSSHGIQQALDLLRRFVGVPYLWGGRSPFGFDCSGLAQIFYSLLQIRLPRDADQQFRACQPVRGRPQPGDLLFFGEAPGQAQTASSPDPLASSITHVAISLGGDHLLHANGTDWGVSYNSLNPADANFRAYLRQHLAGIGRFE